MKRLLVLMSVMSLFLFGCSGGSEDTNQPESTGTETETVETEEKEDTEKSGDLETLKVSYIFTNHQTPLMVAAQLGDKITTDDSKVYLEEVVPKEKFILKDGDKDIANVELVVAKSGSETTTMLAQKHVDISMASNTAFVTARDQGTPVKILAPVHTEGIGFVVPKDSELQSWDDMIAKIGEKEEPLKVGYHSPTSAPIMLLEGALEDAGISYTKNPSEIDKDILLVDLKGTNNLIPALTSSQVDAWVGPSPYPELAQTEGVGKIILDMKDVPPEGKWHDFPCCVVASREDVIEEKEPVVQEFVELIANAASYAEENHEEAAVVTSDFIGIDEEAAKISKIKYTADPSEQWVNNMEVTFQTLKDTNSIEQKFKDMPYEDFAKEMYEFKFIDKVLNK